MRKNINSQTHTVSQTVCSSGVAVVRVESEIMRGSIAFKDASVLKWGSDTTASR